METDAIVAISFFVGFVFAGVLILMIAGFMKMDKNSERIDSIERRLK